MLLAVSPKAWFSSPLLFKKNFNAAQTNNRHRVSLTGSLHLGDVLLEVVSLLDDLIDHVVHGQPSLHVPAETQQVTSGESDD